MLKRNLHNSTLRGRTEKSLDGNHTVYYALYDQVGARSVAATRQNEFSVLHHKNHIMGIGAIRHEDGNICKNGKQI